MKNRLLINRLFSGVAAFSLLFNTLVAPLTVYADESPTPTPTASPDETSSPTPAPEETIAPAPTDTPTDVPSPTATDVITTTEVTPTPAATDDVTPPPSAEVQPAVNSDSTPTTAGPPSEPQVSGASIQVPETPAPTSSVKTGTISAVILKDTQAASLDNFDLTVQTDGSATISTDKLDYAPTDSVLVTGSGFTAGKTYTIIISSSDDPAVTHSDSVTADSQGKIVYSYQLDGNYRPNYKVEVKDGESVVATTTFTDSVSITINWPTSWTTPNSCVSDPANDENPDSIDLVGSASSPAVGFNSDANYQYFREKVHGNPGTASNPVEKAWVVLFQTSSPQYQYLGSLNGKDDKVQLWQNTSASGAVDFNPLLNDPSETLSWQGNSSDYARITSAGGGDYYIDWAIPLSELTSRGITTSATKFFATSADANNFNKDHLVCYEAFADLSIVKSDNPDPVINGGTLTYTLSIHNAGPDIASGVIVTDTLPTGYSVTSVTPNQGSCSDKTAPSIQCELGSMTNGANATITIVGTINGSGTITNTASVSLDTSVSTDLYLSNNTDTEDTTINQPATCGDGSINQSSEQCDNGAQNGVACTPPYGTNGQPASCSYCDTSCHTVTLTDGYCGDNIVNDVSEQCDGTAGVPVHYTCTRSCALQYVPYCGDGQVNQTSEQCDDGNIVNGDGCSSTCQVEPGNISVHKFNDSNANGVEDIGEYGWSDWNMNLYSGTNCQGSSIAPQGTTDDDGNYSFGNLTPGQYSVKETLFPSNSGDDYINTTGGVCQNVTVSAATTTGIKFGNYLKGDIKLCKYNDLNGDGAYNSGEPAMSGWTMYVSGPTGQLSAQTGADGCATFINLPHGSYQVSEENRTGWTRTFPSSATRTVEMVSATSIGLQFYNHRDTGTLTVIKHVINDNGGTKNASDFTINVTGGTPSSFAGSESGTTVTILSNDSYSVSETPIAGYANSYSTDCTGTMTAGGNKTCTITNDDIAPSLHLRKILVIDNGGTAVATDWTLQAAGPTPLSGTTPVDSGATFSAGTYTLSETGPAGYTTSAWNCVGGSQSGSNIALGLGESATCTITNNDMAPRLHLLKRIINDNGGTSTVADFTLTADGTGSNDLSGTSPVNSGATLQAGTFTLSETGPAGYATSPWVCIGGTQVGNQITIKNNEEATCTITNDDIAPTLTLIKTVVNDNGGTKAVSDFPLFINGNPVTSGQTNTLLANTLYTASETGNSGYTASNWGGDCNENGTITLSPGDSKICTITNNDKSGTLIVKKIVVNDNGGTLGASDFSFAVNGGDPQSFNENGEKDLTVNAGSYTVTEPSVTGYSTTYDNCTRVQVTNGGSATCTITNDDIQPILKVVKVVVNDNGGVAVVGDFTLKVSDTNVISGDANSFNAGNYVVSETGGPSGYTEKISGDCDENGNVTLAVGDELKTCTITNDDQPGTLIVKKVIDGGEAVFGNFSFKVNGGDPITFDQDGQNELTVDAGNYSITEPKVDNYAASYNNCTEIQIANGGSATCTITNTWQNPKLTISKSNDKPGGVGQSDTITYSLALQNTGNVEVDNITVSDVPAGGFTYVAGSTTIDGVASSDPTISGGELFWTIPSLSAGGTVVIIYKLTTPSDLVAGIYTNYATCTGGQIMFRSEKIEGAIEGKGVSCDPVTSTVAMGQNTSYGGGLTPQVLGAATELPATGSDTGLVVFAIVALSAGIVLKRKGARKHAKN